eukprot:jgi/Mesen1/7016/ME000365S06149
MRRPSVLFLVLVALIVSGALRFGIEFKGSDLRQQARLRTWLQQLPGRDWLQEVGGHDWFQEVGAHDLLQTICKYPDQASRKEEELTPDSVTPTPGTNAGLSGPAWKVPPEAAVAFPPGAVIDPSKFRLHIKVLVFDRTDSALRCLRSLEEALYEGDQVNVDIYVDHVFNAERSKWNKKAAERVAGSHALLAAVDAFVWSHGEKRVHYRTSNSGIQPQWLEAWWPESVNDFAFVVEDDMQVSPVFYRYFKRMLSTYYYDQANFNPQVYGLSFQRQYFVPGYGGRPMVQGGGPFLYQLVGTWGQFLFPMPWKAFRVWYDARRFNESRAPVLEGLKTTQWWRNKGNKLWTPWVIKWAHARHMYNLYPSFGGNKSLSVSHREVGSNFKVNRGSDADLIQEADARSMALLSPDSAAGAMAPGKALVRRDFCFRQVPAGGVARTLEELHALLQSVHEKKEVALIMAPRGAPNVVRNFLCHVDGLNLRNFVFLVHSASEAAELRVRGYAAFLLAAAGPQERDLSNTPEGLNAWSEQHMRVVSAVLALGYHALVSNADVVWHGNPFKSLADPGFDMIGALDADDFCRNFVYIYSNGGTIATWHEIAHGWGAAGGEPLAPSKSQELAGLLMGQSLSFKMVETLPLVSVDEIGARGATGPDTVPVVLSPAGVPRTEYTARLASAGLWLLDDFDLACKSVTCRKKFPSS